MTFTLHNVQHIPTQPKFQGFLEKHEEHLARLRQIKEEKLSFMQEQEQVFRDEFDAFVRDDLMPSIQDTYGVVDTTKELQLTDLILPKLYERFMPKPLLLQINELKQELGV